jgi:hypothetical protein
MVGEIEGLEEMLQEELKEQKKEIDDMYGFFSGKEAEEGNKPEVELENKKEEEVVVEKPEEKKEEVKEEVEPKKEELEPKKEEVVVEKKEEVDPLEATKAEYESQLAALRAEVNRLAGLQARDGKEQIFPPLEKKEEKKPEQEEGKKEKLPTGKLLENLFTKKEYLTAEQKDSIIDHPEILNDLLHSSKTDVAQTLLEVLPVLINTAVTSELIMHNAVSAFYEEHQDLRPFRNAVQSVFKEVEDKNRDKSYEEIFKETAVECRKRLGLKEPAKQAAQPASVQKEAQKPAFAGSKSGTASSVRKDGKQEFFDENARDLL